MSVSLHRPTFTFSDFLNICAHNMAAARDYKVAELTAADFDQWSALFMRYLEFYKTSLDQEQYTKTFERLVQKHNGLQGLVVRETVGDKKALVGFAHFFPMQTTWSERNIMFLDGKHIPPAQAFPFGTCECLEAWNWFRALEPGDKLNATTNRFQDLFVDPSVRNRGLGGSLIRSVADIARSSGCFRVQWTTQHDNLLAQALYNKLATSEFREYRLVLA